jgi:hypothetical protein
MALPVLRSPRRPTTTAGRDAGLLHGPLLGTLGSEVVGVAWQATAGDGRVIGLAGAEYDGHASTSDLSTGTAAIRFF